MRHEETDLLRDARGALSEIKAIRDETLQTSAAIRGVLAAYKERWQWQYGSWWFKWRQDRLRRRLEKSNPLRCAWPWTICDEGAVQRVRWDVLHERGFKNDHLCERHRLVLGLEIEDKRESIVGN